jgi:hypothetical protein
VCCHIVVTWCYILNAQLFLQPQVMPYQHCVNYNSWGVWIGNHGIPNHTWHTCYVHARMCTHSHTVFSCLFMIIIVGIFPLPWITKSYPILNYVFWEKFSHWFFICSCYPLFHVIWFHLQYVWNREVPRPFRSLLELWQVLIMMIISEKITKVNWYTWQK